MKVKPLLQCHLLVTGLSPEKAAAAPRMVALESLLALAGQHARTEESPESWLCRSFGVAQQGDWPIAPIAALGDGLVPGEAHWLCADPVHFHLLRDRIVVVDVTEGWEPSERALSEAKALVAALNRHFAEDGLQFFAPQASCWYLRLPKQPVLRTQPLAETVGQDVDSCLPQGTDAMLWHGRLNEVQMLLHDHPVNLDREQRGQLPINSIWPWGGGVMVKPASCPFAGVWAENALARGLAIASNSELQRLPTSAGEWLDSNLGDGTHLLVLDTLKQAGENVIGAFERMEQQWFAPLLEALKHGRVASIHLHLAQVHQVRSFSVERGDVWKFWRRPKPLKAFIDG